MARVLSSYGNSGHSASIVRHPGKQYLVVELEDGESNTEVFDSLDDAKTAFKDKIASIEEAEKGDDEDDDD
jgi:hypothetical protein